jgi:hypothetical protein
MDGLAMELRPPAQVRSGYPLSGGRSFVGIAGGTFHSLAYANDGTVWSWGFGPGQLGNGSTADSHAPVQVNGILAGHKAVSVVVFVTVWLRSGQFSAVANARMTVGWRLHGQRLIDDGSMIPTAATLSHLRKTPAGPYPLGPTTTLTATG